MYLIKQNSLQCYNTILNVFLNLTDLCITQYITITYLSIQLYTVILHYLSHHRKVANICSPFSQFLHYLFYCSEVYNIFECHSFFSFMLQPILIYYKKLILHFFRYHCYIETLFPEPVVVNIRLRSIQ